MDISRVSFNFWQGPVKKCLSPLRERVFNQIATFESDLLKTYQYINISPQTLKILQTIEQSSYKKIATTFQGLFKDHIRFSRTTC